jgi:hypothetical protein
MEEKPRQFDALKFANVLEPVRESRVDVITRDAERVRCPVFLPALVAAKTIEHQLDHIALAVMRWRHMGKNEQLHARFGRIQISNLRENGSGRKIFLRGAKLRWAAFLISMPLHEPISPTSVTALS